MTTKTKKAPKRTKKAKSSPPKVSTDLSAEEAIKHIEDTPKKKLNGFVPKEEDRKTVIDAYQKAFATNKDLVYLAWKDGETDVEKLHAHVDKNVKQNTIKGWLSRWGRGKGLPRIASDK